VDSGEPERVIAMREDFQRVTAERCQPPSSAQLWRRG
jgi:hypothetical protein